MGPEDRMKGPFSTIRSIPGTRVDAEASHPTFPFFATRWLAKARRRPNRQKSTFPFSHGPPAFHEDSSHFVVGRDSAKPTEEAIDQDRPGSVRLIRDQSAALSITRRSPPTLATHSSSRGCGNTFGNILIVKEWLRAWAVKSSGGSPLEGGQRAGLPNVADLSSRAKSTLPAGVARVCFISDGRIDVCDYGIGRSAWLIHPNWYLR